MTRSGRALLALLVAVVVVVGGVAPADAQTASQKRRRQAEISRQMRQLRDNLEQASEEEEQLATRVADAERRRLELDRRVVALDGQIRRTRSELGRAETALDGVEQHLRRTEAELAATEQELVDARDQLRRRAVTAYVGRSSSEVADVALGLRDVREITALQTYVRALVKAQRETVDRFRALRQQIDELRAGLESSRAEAERQRDLVASRKAGLEQARRQQDEVRHEVAAEQVRHQGLLQEVKQRAAAYERQLTELKRESDSIEAFLKKLQSQQGAPTIGKGVLAMPVPGARLTSRFGPRTHPVLRTTRMHTGVDFGAGAGTPIRAAGDGVVVYAGYRGGYGNTVIIDHGGSLATLYAHQSQLLAAGGQRVARGQVIGRVGSTGMSTGPHLHFEVRVGGTPVDPLRYL